MLLYAEVYNDEWSMCVCSSVYCDSFLVQYFLAQLTGCKKISLYGESYEYVEAYDVYNGIWSMHVCRCLDCGNLFLHNIYGAVDRLAWIGDPNRKSGAKFSSYVESYKHIWNVCAYMYPIVTVGAIIFGQSPKGQDCLNYPWLSCRLHINQN